MGLCVGLMLRLGGSPTSGGPRDLLSGRAVPRTSEAKLHLGAARPSSHHSAHSITPHVPLFLPQPCNRDMGAAGACRMWEHWESLSPLCSHRKMLCGACSRVVLVLMLMAMSLCSAAGEYQPGDAVMLLPCIRFQTNPHPFGNVTTCSAPNKPLLELAWSKRGGRAPWGPPLSQ